MNKQPKKYIFVTGGVVSSLGKGLSCASLGALLEARGLRVNICKIDPYLNVDPGTMSPIQHGEVFVTDDGAETDLDLGHYERFLSIQTNRQNNFTAGQIYETVIRKERKGDYLGGTVQVIPHVTDEIKSRIRQAAGDYDVCIGEIGGTVGDIEGLPFLEAVRQFRHDVGRDNVLYIHLTLVPFIAAAGEIKTKPTQHSVKELTNLGIQPDIIILRSEAEVDAKSKEKISLFCNVEKRNVVTAPDVSSIYNLPLVFHEQGVDDQICEKLNMWTAAPQLASWSKINSSLTSPANGEVNIAMVGKYVELQESYKSVSEALVHGGIANDVRVNITYVDSSQMEGGDIPEALKLADGVLVPGGFGKRGGEGKINAVKYARTNGVPFFGICLGMQIAVVEFARNAASISGAASSEFEPGAEHLIVALMEEQEEVTDMGGSMRLGGYPCVLEKGSKVESIYKTSEIRERHRHRWEFNNKYKDLLSKAGMSFSGVSPDKKLVEIIEIPDHPWFVGVQFHPEFRSRPYEPHPLFASFIKAARKK